VRSGFQGQRTGMLLRASPSGLKSKVHARWLVPSGCFVKSVALPHWQGQRSDARQGQPEIPRSAKGHEAPTGSYTGMY
jgi:hypothetical protein